MTVSFIDVIDLVEQPGDAEARENLDALNTRLFAQKNGEFYTVQFDDALAVFLAKE